MLRNLIKRLKESFWRFTNCQTTYKSVKSVNFSDPSTWVNGLIPKPGGNVIIDSGHTVTLQHICEVNTAEEHVEKYLGELVDKEGD